MQIEHNIFQNSLLKVLNTVNDINFYIFTGKLNTISEIKKQYISLKNSVDQSMPETCTITLEGKNVNCKKELYREIEKAYSLSLRVFKEKAWGQFAGINPKNYPELYSMMVDQNGDLSRSFDNFHGTVAVMDFHGYTQFSNDIKYNKTPLQEFGDVLPAKIETICQICKSVVYEMEGDAIILIGPENPVYIMNAVLSIIEISRQKPLKQGADPGKSHGITIKNPLMKPFEMNAAITTGGETYINHNGRIVGSLISEAHRILKIINTKKPYKSGILMSDKVVRKLEKSKSSQSVPWHVSPHDFTIGPVVAVDVKGMRLHIREMFLEEKGYIGSSQDYQAKLVDEIKKKSPSKWYNILITYVNLVLTAMKNVKFSIKLGAEELKQDRVKVLLMDKLEAWISQPSAETIYGILKICDLIFRNSEEVKDVTAVYNEFIQENYTFIARTLEDFYEGSMKKETENNPQLKKVVDLYNLELKKMKKRFLPRRILETVLSDENLTSQLMPVPYMGKK
jgi:hypothetical protein